MIPYVISDTHFSNKGVVKHLGENGLKMRPFETIEEMDEVMIENWNNIVKPKDKVYHLGDVVINRYALKILSRLNGRKVLIKGNHDNFRLLEYAEYFEDICAYHVLDNIIFSHIPIHPSSKYRYKGNVHGHLHDKIVKDPLTGEKDPWYYNVSVEQINYTPISFSVISKYYDFILC